MCRTRIRIIYTRYYNIVNRVKVKENLIFYCNTRLKNYVSTCNIIINHTFINNNNMNTGVRCPNLLYYYIGQSVRRENYFFCIIIYKFLLV